jgi:uncharacterized protein YbaP (TraB family)
MRPRSDRKARPFRVFIAALAFLLAASPALAAPSWWRVSDGHSEVWIIGAPNLVPDNFAWDQHAVDERLKGALTLIIEPQQTGGLKMIGSLIGGAAGLHSSTQLETSLPQPLRDRFVAARNSIGQGPGHYANWKPVAAGVLLTNDFVKAANLKTGEVAKAVRQLARKNGVHETPSGSYDGGQLITAAGQLGLAAQETCLAAEVHQVEQGAARLRSNAQDWARGVIHPNPTDPADQACLNAMPQMRSLNDRLVGYEVQAVADGLKKPGHAVAVFDLGAVTMPGGVLDRLRARGLQVSAPMP